MTATALTQTVAPTARITSPAASLVAPLVGVAGRIAATKVGGGLVELGVLAIPGLAGDAFSQKSISSAPCSSEFGRYPSAEGRMWHRPEGVKCGYLAEFQLAVQLGSPNTARTTDRSQDLQDQQDGSRSAKIGRRPHNSMTDRWGSGSRGLVS